MCLSELKKKDFNILKNDKKEEYNKICSNLRVILKGQKINQKDMRLYLIVFGIRNNELLESNKKLNQQLEKVVKELNVLKKEREEKQARKEARANRKRLPKRNRVTPEIYQALINATKANIISYNSYTAGRLRVVY